MTKTKTTTKRTFAFLLSFMLLFTTMVTASESVGALSSSENAHLSFMSSDVKWTTRTQFIGVDGNTSYVFEKGEVLYPIQLTQNGTSEIVYCVEPGKGTNVSDTYNVNSPNAYDDLSFSQQYAIGLILTYGYPNNSALIGDTDDKYVATQLLIWEIVKGYRGVDRSSNGKSYTKNNSKFYDGMSGNSNVVTNYNIIQNALQYHWTIPSFASDRENLAQTYKMSYNESTGKYSVTLTDTNNVLSQYSFESENGVIITQNGSKLTITSDRDISGTPSLSAQKNVLKNVNDAKIINSVEIWGNNSYANGKGQSVVAMGTKSDPPKAFLKVKTTTSSYLDIVKTSEDGNVSDIYFKIEGNSLAPIGGSFTVKTDENGRFEVDLDAQNLLAGYEWTITELGYKNADGSYSLPSYYDEQPAQTVVVEPNKTTTVSFYNNRNDEELHIYKTSDDNKVSDIAFLVEDLTNNETLGIFTTGTNGKIDVPSSQLEYHHTYKVTELGTLKKGATAGSQNADDYELSKIYAEQQAKTITLKPDSDNNTVSFHNTILQGKIKVIKAVEAVDSAESVDLSGYQFRVQGISVNGISYDKTFTTDANGYIEIPELLIGTYKVSEVENDKTVGYILPDSQTIDLTVDGAEVNFENKLMRGDLTVVKTFEGRTTPLENVPFHITGILTATGEMYDLGTLYTDNNGKIELTNLPVGTYTVEELESELISDYVLSEAQTVQVAYDKLTELKINNELKTGEVVIKKTSEDGIIEGVEFEVYVNGTLKGTYKTNSKGEITIKDLKYNDSVRVHEVPNERYQATKDITKTIKSKTTTFEFENKLKTRNIEIIKTSEDNIVAGIDFTVTVNDILLGTYTTDENGIIEIQNFLIGNYIVSEVANSKTIGYILPEEQ